MSTRQDARRRLGRRLAMGLALLAVVGLALARCTPPTPRPQASETAGQGYPRLAALFSQPDKTTATNTLWLQRLADTYDIGVFWHDAHLWPVDGSNPVAWIQARAPQFRALAYAPAGYWWQRDDSCAITPTRCEVRALLDANDWWLWAPDGRRVTGWTDSALIDTPRAAAGLQAYWAAWFRGTPYDGMAWDVTDGNMHYRGGAVDFDRNGAADGEEHGRLWLDDVWTAGLRGLTAGIGEGSIGNGAWMPRWQEELSQLAPPLRGSIVELPSRWRDPESGRWLPGPQSELIHWHIANLLALRARDPESMYLILSKPDLFQTTYWRQWLPEAVDQERLALGVALLTDNAALQIAYGNVPWCDECGVSGGSTAWTAHWLGAPLGPAARAGDVWRREFERGAVYLNAGEHVQQAAGVDAALRQIRGWYDQAHNAGGAWDGRLEAYETRVLWRAGAPAVAPTATSAPTVTLGELLERIEALETRVAQ